ncbi:DUF4013 domain-containing protein [Halobaculum sp. MBLA0143]|uniref:DUF4013 domain-containing protein n=1 Tax=Halobaculum sp. MBLA0143 TaxID=3079933 RepID=UPI003525333F
MLRDAIEFPVRGDDAAKTILIGGLLSVFGVLLVPVIPLVGYLQQVFRTTAAGDETPPVFDDVEGLFADGLRAVAVSLVYFALPLLVGLFTFVAVAMFVPAAFVSAGSGADPGAVSAVGGVVVFALLGLGLLSTLWTLAASYLLPPALARVAETDEVRSGFALRSVWDTAATMEYLTAWLLAVLVGVVASAVFSAVAAPTLVGGLLVPFGSFYLAVVTVRLYAEGVAAATRSGGEPEPREQVV